MQLKKSKHIFKKKKKQDYLGAIFYVRILSRKYFQHAIFIISPSSICVTYIFILTPAVLMCKEYHIPDSNNISKQF